MRGREAHGINKVGLTVSTRCTLKNISRSLFKAPIGLERSLKVLGCVRSRKWLLW